MLTEVMFLDFAMVPNAIVSNIHLYMAVIIMVNGLNLDFECIDTVNGTNNNNSGNYKIIDKQTKSEWNFEGRAINGQLKGKQLVRLPFDEGFWFEW